MNEFNVGDYVKCLKGFSCVGGPEVGKVYKVLSKHTDIIGIHCPDYEYSTDIEYMLGTKPNYSKNHFKLSAKEKDIPKILDTGWGFEND